jgi:hypothetical protein
MIIICELGLIRPVRTRLEFNRIGPGFGPNLARGLARLESPDSFSGLEIRGLRFEMATGRRAVFPVVPISPVQFRRSGVAIRMSRAGQTPVRADYCAPIGA